MEVADYWEVIPIQGVPCVDAHAGAWLYQLVGTEHIVESALGLVYLPSDRDVRVGLLEWVEVAE